MIRLVIPPSLPPTVFKANTFLEVVPVVFVHILSIIHVANVYKSYLKKILYVNI